MNVWDIIILLAIAIAVLLGIRSMIKGKAGGCSGRCDGCPMNKDGGSCNIKPPNTEE